MLEWVSIPMDTSFDTNELSQGRIEDFIVQVTVDMVEGTQEGEERIESVV